jgi:hypothetical protein
MDDYNKQVALAEKFLIDKVEDCEDELRAARTEKFQNTARGKQIAVWIEHLRAETLKKHTVDLNVSDYIDSDDTNFADALEDLEKEA